MTSRRLARSVALAVLLAISLFVTPQRHSPGTKLRQAVLIPPVSYDRADAFVVDDRVRQALVTTTTVAEHAGPAAATRGAPRRHVMTTSVTSPPVVHQDAESGWARLRQCESGGNYRDNTGNGYFGAYQFSLRTWNATAKRANRPDLIGVLPSNASVADQDLLAGTLDAISGAGQWPRCGRYIR